MDCAAEQGSDTTAVATFCGLHSPRDEDGFLLQSVGPEGSGLSRQLGVTLLCFQRWCSVGVSDGESQSVPLSLQCSALTCGHLNVQDLCCQHAVLVMPS